MTINRIYRDDTPQLLTCNITDRFNFFEETKFTQTISELLLELEIKLDFELFAFTFMPDHLHISLKPGKFNISKIMQQFKSLSYKKIRDNHSFKDKFWQKSFDFKIKNNSKMFLTSIEYIKNNPQKFNLPKKYYKLPYMYINKEKVKIMVDFLNN